MRATSQPPSKPPPHLNPPGLARLSKQNRGVLKMVSMKRRASLKVPIVKEKVLNATNTFMSLFASSGQIREDDSSSSSSPVSTPTTPTSSNTTSLADFIIPSTPPLIRRNQSWLNKRRNSNERRQSCRRVNSRRDWSGELEEHEYRLPFAIDLEETERGGLKPDEGDGAMKLPRLDTNVGQGLMIDLDGLSPLVTSTTESEWSGVLHEEREEEMRELGM